MLLKCSSACLSRTDSRRLYRNSLAIKILDRMRTNTHTLIIKVRVVLLDPNLNIN